MVFSKAATDFLRFWVIPKGFQDIMSDLYRNNLYYMISDKSILKINKKFANIHKGKRCFIIANGPSIKIQDLKPLKNEICFSVNNGFVHPDYEIYRPIYHCLPQIEDHYSENKIKWLIEMDKRTLDAQLFTSVGNKKDINENGLFRNRVNYIYFSGNIKSLKHQEIDITNNIPLIYTSPQICILLAIYMGFNKIYLLGCDHDAITHFGISTHFYNENENTSGKEIWGTFESELRALLSVWEWYKKIKEYAEVKNIHIYNATKGGLLDVFERVNYESLINV